MTISVDLTSEAGQSIEREIILGMITSTDFLTKISTVYQPRVLKSRPAQIVADWCVEYWGHHHRAPGRDIQSIFVAQTANLRDADRESVERLLVLAETNNREKDYNVEFHIDAAVKHIRGCALDRLRDDISTAMMGGRIDDAERLITEYARPQIVDVTTIDPFHSPAVLGMFDEEGSADQLVKYYGTLGDEVGWFENGQLFAILAGSGVGKTWWLWVTAMRGLMMGFRVLFVTLEMTVPQIVRRGWHWITARPTMRFDHAPIQIPEFDCLHNQTGKCTDRCSKVIVVDETGRMTPFERAREHVPCRVCRHESPNRWSPAVWHHEITRGALKADHIIDAQGSWEKYPVVNPDRFRVIEMTPGVDRVSTLHTALHNMATYDGWRPQMVLTDYADEFGFDGSDYRHGIHSVWRDHKALAKELKIFVGTASQSNTARTGADIKQGDWAEDIRKLNLIDGGMAINQRPTEKELGIFRMLSVKDRDDYFNWTRQIMVLGQLKIARPYLDSTILKKNS